MFVIRPSTDGDLDALLAVAEHLDTVNLPADRDALARILALSSQSFAAAVPTAEREYLFLLEDAAAGQVVGTSMIHAQHGTRRAPHVFLHVLPDEHYSETLDRYLVHQCLQIGYNYDGPTEIGGLILLPDHRGRPERLGKLLSYVRFLFIAMHREEFRDEVLSELMPPLEEDGTSRLWKHLGKRFTDLTYQEADRLSKYNKEFIKSLFPHGLIYTALLPEDVQAVIGQVGPETKGVEAMLRRIGFEYANQIDPFDGGPHFVARTDEVTLVQDARRVQVERLASAPAGPWSIVARAGEARDFRAVGAAASVAEDGASVGLDEATCAALGLSTGDTAWVVTP